MTTQYRTKPGRHGTLYLWSVPWTDPLTDERGVDRMWGYNAEHAVERFIDKCDFEGYPEVVLHNDVVRVRGA